MEVNSEQGWRVLEWGVICNVKEGGEGALIKKVVFDLRPTRGEEGHLADT